MAASSRRDSRSDHIRRENTGVFVKKDGTPLIFHLPPGATKKKLAPLIQNGGGVVTSKKRQNGICLADEKLGRSAIKAKDHFWPSYVLDCIKQNKALDLEDYRCSRGMKHMRRIPGSDDEEVEEIDDGMAPASTVITIQPSAKRGRTKYSKADDMNILRYLVEENQYNHAAGKAVWRTMESLQITNHTAESMRTRFHKMILLNLNDYNIPDSWKSKLTGNTALAIASASTSSSAGHRQTKLMDSLASSSSTHRQDDDPSAASDDDGGAEGDGLSCTQPFDVSGETRQTRNLHHQGRTADADGDDEDDDFDRGLIEMAESFGSQEDQPSNKNDTASRSSPRKTRPSSWQQNQKIASRRESPRKHKKSEKDGDQVSLSNAADFSASRRDAEKPAAADSEVSRSQSKRRLLPQRDTEEFHTSDGAQSGARSKDRRTLSQNERDAERPEGDNERGSSQPKSKRSISRRGVEDGEMVDNEQRDLPSKSSRTLSLRDADRRKVADGEHGSQGEGSDRVTHGHSQDSQPDSRKNKRKIVSEISASQSSKRRARSVTDADTSNVDSPAVSPNKKKKHTAVIEDSDDDHQDASQLNGTQNSQEHGNSDESRRDKREFVNSIGLISQKDLSQRSQNHNASKSERSLRKSQNRGLQSESPRKTKSLDFVKGGKQSPGRRRQRAHNSQKESISVDFDSREEDGGATWQDRRHPNSSGAWKTIQLLCKEFDLTERQARVCLWQSSGDVVATRFWILTGTTLPDHWVWTREDDEVLRDCEPDHPDWQYLETSRGLQAVLKRQRWLMGQTEPEPDATAAKQSLSVKKARSIYSSSSSSSDEEDKTKTAATPAAATKPQAKPAAEKKNLSSSSSDSSSDAAAATQATLNAAATAKPPAKPAAKKHDSTSSSSNDDTKVQAAAKPAVSRSAVTPFHVQRVYWRVIPERNHASVDALDMERVKIIAKKDSSSSSSDSSSEDDAKAKASAASKPAAAQLLTKSTKKDASSSSSDSSSEDEAKTKPVPKPAAAAKPQAKPATNKVASSSFSSVSRSRSDGCTVRAATPRPAAVSKAPAKKAASSLGSSDPSSSVDEAKKTATSKSAAKMQVILAQSKTPLFWDKVFFRNQPSASAPPYPIFKASHTYVRPSQHPTSSRVRESTHTYACTHTKIYFS